MTKRAEYNKRYLQKHPEQRRKNRQTNYAKRRFGNWRRWIPAEVDLLKRFEGTDTELAVAMQRSVQSIQGKRNKLKSKGLL